MKLYYKRKQHPTFAEYYLSTEGEYYAISVEEIIAKGFYLTVWYWTGQSWREAKSYKLLDRAAVDTTLRQIAEAGENFNSVAPYNETEIEQPDGQKIKRREVEDYKATLPKAAGE